MANTLLSLNDFEQINEIIQRYFQGLYQGDVKKLKAIFHADVCLKAPEQRRPLAQWLAAVSERESPEAQQQDFGFQVLAIDIVQDQAMVKVKCPLFTYNYIDFIGLLKEEGKWLIVSKMYTDVARTPYLNN